jgi:hypothetical protein
MPKSVRCPTCGRAVPWVPASAYRPFCSERCRLIDLGDWFDEKHRICEPLDDRSDGPGPDPGPDSGSDSGSDFDQDPGPDLSNHGRGGWPRH